MKAVFENLIIGILSAKKRQILALQAHHEDAFILLAQLVLAVLQMFFVDLLISVNLRRQTIDVKCLA